MDNLFGEVIHSYTAQQAVEDGVLVAVSPRDMVTCAVWTYLKEKVELGKNDPPHSWPIPLFKWLRIGTLTQEQALKMIAKSGLEAQQEFEYQIRHDRALALSEGLMDRDRQQAQRAEDAGGIYELHVDDAGGVLRGLVNTGGGTTRTLWMRPNDLGGMTLMFPEDN